MNRAKQVVKCLAITAILYFAFILNATAEPSGFQCRGPTNEVDVRITESPGADGNEYEFLLSNHSELPIWALSVGDSNEMLMRQNTYQTITITSSSEKWESSVIENRGTSQVYMLLTWSVIDVDNVNLDAIQPGATSATYRIKVTKPPVDYVPKVDIDDVVEKSYDVASLPFRVELAGGECLWGWIGK
jgi:hypothetical protein